MTREVFVFGVVIVVDADINVGVDVEVVSSSSPPSAPLPLLCRFRRLRFLLRSFDFVFCTSSALGGREEVDEAVNNRPVRGSGADTSAGSDRSDQTESRRLGFI